MKIIDRIIVDNKAPNNTNVIWIDTSKPEPIQRYYQNGEWKPLVGASNTNTVTHNSLTLDTHPIEGSTNPITSGAVYNVEQKIPGILEMYIPPVGSYSRASFESQSGITLQQFQEALEGKYSMVKKLYDPVIPEVNADPGQPSIHIEPTIGGYPCYCPILSSPNYSAMSLTLELIESNGIRSINYNSSDLYTVSYRGFWS